MLAGTTFAHSSGVPRVSPAGFPHLEWGAAQGRGRPSDDGG